MFKKLDAETVVVILLCGVLLISWNYLFGPNGLDWIPKQQSKTVITDVEKNSLQAPSISSSANEAKTSQVQTINPAFSPGKTSLPDNVNNNTSSNSIRKDSSPTIEELPDVKISNPLMDVIINPLSGQIASIELKNFLSRDKQHNVQLDKDVSPGALSLSFPYTEMTLVKIAIIGSDNKSCVLSRIFSLPDHSLFQLKQTWSLSGSYVINYSFEFQNESGNDIVFPEMLVWAGTMPPIKYLAGDNVLVSESHGIDRCMATNNAVIETRANDSIFDSRATQENPVKWIGVSNKYFACVLKPRQPFSDGNVSKRTKMTNTSAQSGEKEDFYIVYTAGCIKNISLPSFSSKMWEFSYYAGPKSILLLKDFDPNAPFIMHLAWKYIDSVSQWLLYALIFLKNLAGSYGMAIILLTLIVKLLFWPITHKSNQSMKKMQKIQPLIAELREKYKDDKQKLNVKLMDLYKKEKINPLGGCLPIFLQIPVFIALYWTLDGAIELRHTHFLWADDLTLPDTVFTFSWFFNLPINPWAIMMAATMFVQQKMTPTAMDPMQEKMMLLMPLVMLFVLYNLPSGLTLYWTVSQIISIVQLVVNRYFESSENPHKQNLKTA